MSYKVFISFKNLDANGRPTRDSIIAEQLYRKLNILGIETFFSNEEVQRKARPDYGNLIDEALESSCVLLLVGTCVEYIESRWIRYEWDCFKSEINSGRKEGYIIPIIENISIGDLPFALRHGQVYAASEIDKAVDMVAGVLGVSDSAAKKAREWYKEGNDYYFGNNGKTRDCAKAVECFRKAAEQGHTVAQSNMGLCYYSGEGVPLNYAEAVRWFRLSAEKGYSGAQSNLGLCYYNGHGVSQNYSEAVRWFSMAAEQGVAVAQLNLGCCCYNGEGVPQNYADAVKWYRKAAEQGNADAQANLGLCCYYGNGVPQDYDEAARWYLKAAEKGHAGAQYLIGECYENGEGVTRDRIEAIKWYRKAAEQGDEDAIKALERFR